MKKIFPILFVFTLLLPIQVKAAPPRNPSMAPRASVGVPGGPSFRVANVVRNTSITIQVSNFPTGQKYSVTLGKIGNQFGYGTKVGVLDDSMGIEFSITYSIPGLLHGERLLGVQLKHNITGARGYDIFENTTGWNSSKPYSLYPDASSPTDSGGNSVTILGGPTFSVQDVIQDLKVTIRLSDYPINEKFRVTMGPVGEQDNPGRDVGLIDGSFGQNFSIKFDIPEQLFPEDEIFIRLENTFTQNYGYAAFTNAHPWAHVPLPPSASSFTSSQVTSTFSGGTPFTAILNVVANSEVTLQTFNFPADKEFIVTMGQNGTRGIGGLVVGVQNSGLGGSFIATYPIPASLQNETMIAIRLQSTTSGHYAYNWFYNSSGNDPVVSTSTGSTLPSLPPGMYPTFSVSGVSEDNSVTITTYNLTTNDTYTVIIGAYGTYGIGGTVVSSQDSGAGGTISATYVIPPAFYGATKIAIRLESPISGYYAFNWFWNDNYP
ncbi:MAG: hypothetical protein FVQ83_13445 [Chloroflexi bacterium]|nr:hypothetical protein [Chloroflexota bacterium]